MAVMGRNASLEQRGRGWQLEDIYMQPGDGFFVL
jgi:hypothetical protein